MTNPDFDRRKLLAAGGVALTGAAFGLSGPALAQSFPATRTMRGGSNNYRPGAPIVERIGGGGFWMAGTVQRAGDGAPLAGQRIQVWAHITEGHERDARSHGATLSDENGVFGSRCRRLCLPSARPMRIWPTTATTSKLCSCVP